MTDPSGLRVIEALCPAVSRYAMACPPYPMAKPIECAPSLGTATEFGVSDDWQSVDGGWGHMTLFSRQLFREVMARAITEMRTYESPDTVL